MSTSNVTSFVNGSNPTFTAGTTTSSTACSESTAQGTSGATTGVGGSGPTSTSTIDAAGPGVPGSVALTWTALPGAPTGVSGTGGNGQIAASWTAPSDPGTASISGYTLTATPLPSGTTVSHTFSSTATSETLTGLTNGTSYDLSVAAVTTVGTGPSANASNNPITPGVAPTITSANSTTFTAGSAGSFTVTTAGHPDAGHHRVGLATQHGDLHRQRQRHGLLVRHPDVGDGSPTRSRINAANGISPNATQSFTLNVDQAPTITSADSTTFAVGSAGTFTVTTSGLPPRPDRSRDPCPPGSPSSTTGTGRPPCPAPRRQARAASTP